MMFKHSICFLLLLVALPGWFGPGYADISLPPNDSLWSTFDDSTDSGKSRSIQLKIFSDHVEWVFRMDSGAPWPYVGLAVTLQFPDSIGKNWQRFNENDTLLLELSSNREGPVVIQVITVDPRITKTDDPVSFRVNQTSISVTSGKRLVAIPLRTFRVADWWKTKYNVPPEDTNLYLDSITSVDFVFTDAARIGCIDTLWIHQLRLKHRDKNSFTSVIALIMISSIVLVLTMRKFTFFQSGRPVVISDTFNPTPIGSVPSEWQRVKSFLESNYHDPGLNLQKCAAILCLSESKLTRLIKQNHQSGFRSLIHDLRTCEAKRLLRETDLNIGEIAFKLGYATPSHFNREFKSREMVTPGEFRKAT